MIYCVGIVWEDWIPLINNIYTEDVIKCVNNLSQIYVKENDLILPMSIRAYIDCQNMPQNLFKKTDINSITILDNKILFAKFMMEKYKEYIPFTIYYSINNEEYYDPTYKGMMITKPMTGSGANGIKVVKNFVKNPSQIVSQYVVHDYYYVCHMLVIDCEVVKKIYFRKRVKHYDVVCGPINKYEIVTPEIFAEISKNAGKEYDDRIFNNIFKELNFSGFACANLTIKNGIPMIFEINPRAGGSLFYNNEVAKDFFDVIKCQDV